MIVRILYYYYKAIFLAHHIKTRERLADYQNQQFKKLVKNSLAQSPFYQSYLDKPFYDWPIINKSIMMEHFDDINTAKIKKEVALKIALQAEETRDFSPLFNKIAVGLSSGTSGQRGLFLTSPRERDMWAGIMLAKALPNGLKTKERIAFFLRANNQLYKTLNQSKKIQFYFFDLLTNFDEHIEALNAIQPTILSAPSSVLVFLAQQKHRLTIQPKKIIAVAEVLEKNDEKAISDAFHLPVAQIYQCTEGFLAISDKTTNNLIMNEEFLIIEKEWLDENRFVPIITDLLRHTQPIIRYRLDDILIEKKTSGAFTELTTIEGREGDILYGRKDSVNIPIFADTIRQKMASSPMEFEDYRICQYDINNFSIQVFPELLDSSKLIAHLNQLFIQIDCDIPQWHWQTYEKKECHIKQRRIMSTMITRNK